MPISRLWPTLAFRLTAGYALAGLVLVILATASLYFVLVSELEKSTELFLGDKLHVLRTTQAIRGRRSFTICLPCSRLRHRLFHDGNRAR
jgi:hypothetical protein